MKRHYMFIATFIFCGILAFSGCARDYNRGESRLSATPEIRFTDNGNGAVTDNFTGLIWLKYPNCFKGTDFFTAGQAAKGLSNGVCGLSDGSVPGDWRLPTVKELFDMVDRSQYMPALPKDHPFQVLMHSIYFDFWTSVSDQADPTSSAWGINVKDGTVYSKIKDLKGGVWPVRSVGDDGGPTMPNPRFTDNGSGAVTDNFTGLTWLKYSNCFKRTNLFTAGQAVKGLSNGGCGLSDGSVPGDWRLPTVKEIFGLVDYSQNMPALPKGHPFQVPDQDLMYFGHFDFWTNVRDKTDPTRAAWVIDVKAGTVKRDIDWHSYGVWPVRSGK